MNDFKVDKAKAKASLLYIVANVPNIDAHKLYKILYFAEQDHLVKFGRPITGDSFIKMQYGPVPSYVKDKIEHNIPNDEDDSVKIDGIKVVISEYPDLDELAESDIECLDSSIATNKDKSFSELVIDSHKEAWTATQFASRINSLSIAVEGHAESGMLDYIKLSLENEASIY